MPVARFEMPDGKIARFEVPEGTTPEQAQSMISSYVDSQEFRTQSEKREPTEQSTGDGFFDRMGRDVKKRLTKRDQIIAARRRGEQGYVESGFQEAGQVGAGLLFDTAGELTTEAARGIAYMTPDFIKEPVKQGVLSTINAVGSLPSFGGGTLKENIPKEIGGVLRGYDEFSKQNPRMARNLESAANIGLLLGPTAKYGEDVLKGGKQTLDAAGQMLTRKKPKVRTSEELRMIATQKFKDAEQAGGYLNSKFVDDVINNFQSKNKQTAFGQAIAGETKFSKITDRLEALKGRGMTFDAAKEIDEALGEMAYDNVDAFGKFNKEGKLFLEAQKDFRRQLETAPRWQVVNPEAFDKLKEARKYWSASLRSRDIERIIEMSDYFDQPATAIRVQFRGLIRRGLTGYTDKQIGLIKRAAKTGIITDGLRLMASGLGPLMTAAGGAISGGPLGVLAGVPAFALREGAKEMSTRRQINRASDVLRSINAGVP